MNTIKLSLAVLALGTAPVAFAAPAAPANPAPATPSSQAPAMTAQDLVTLPRLGNVTVSPDERLAAYTVTTTDPRSYQRSTALWLLPLGTKGATPVKLAWQGSLSDPAFAPDGRLWFLSDKDGKTAQVWSVLPGADGSAGGPRKVTDLAAEVAGFKLSPDGRRLAVWGDIARACPTFGGCADLPHGDGNLGLPGPGTGRLYQDGAGFVRHWDAWETPGIHSRIFAFALNSSGQVDPASGHALDGDPAKGGLTGDAPSKPFGDGSELAWSADSTAVIYAARQADRDEPRSTNLDLWWAPVDGSAPRNLTAANHGTDTTPAVSPDGRWLAWAAMARPGYEADRLVVQLMDLKTGKSRALTQDWDRSASSLAFTPDSKALIVTAEDVLDTPAFRVDLASGQATRLSFQKGREGHVAQIIPLKDGAFLLKRDAVDAAPELYLGKPYLGKLGRPAQRLTDLDASALRAMAPVAVERFSFAGANGDTVWGQILKPAGTTGKLPTVLLVHGGPQGSFNDSWSTRWNPRLWAAQGYAAITIDFHGSTGYGQAFTDSINQDWGGKPLQDLQLGMAAAAAKDGAVDPSNACAAGGSYGGYMMNWIEGQWPDAFKCIIQHDGVFDARAMAYETDELWFDEWEHGGHAYFEAPEAFEKWNPVNHVAKWKTPMLVITSENDFRIPYTQGLASFAALQRRGIPSELLVFPDENHWVLKAKNSLQWHQSVFGWLARWLKPTQPVGK
ncbi:S9 family peptidase [Novosphingobium pokkalii]|uniref:LpqB family beta-propeller domain-containing protein n=1 Tax=Novosphingobium pokkalii TaxID=1770194 RepID=A0ABV7V200_9SPHN|nr:S9 family peptidase [Novosphingobium pokkalii]GHC85459.1 peptidase S9 [Novosphingobium pokkalii]